VLARTATRFAQTSLAIYASEGPFSIGVQSEDEMDLVTAAFEALGCTVERESFRLTLHVRPSNVDSFTTPKTI
jgi:hypothetical protein